MNDTTAKSRWTSKDEATLVELTERKQRIMAENLKPLEDVAIMVLMEAARQMTNQDTEAVVSAMAAHADALRDALAPFDSGVRPG